MKRGLGFNNHYHFLQDLMAETADEFRPENAKKIIIKLLDLTVAATQPFKPRYEAVLQFGHESWPFLNNHNLLEFIKHECKSREVTPVIHQLDQVHPLTQDFDRWVQRYLDIAQEAVSQCLIIHLPPHPVDVLKETAKALTADQVLDSLYQSEIRIALENPGNKEPSPFFGQLENVAALMESIADRLKRARYEDIEGRFGICFDYGHFTEYAFHLNQDVEERMEHFLSVADEKIQALHVHINDGTADQHLLLGEYPPDANLQMLRKFERIYLTALEKLGGRNRIFIVEKGSPFQIQDMIHCFQILDGALPS